MILTLGIIWQKNQLMNKKMSNNKMLPSGFYDLIFDEAKKDFLIKNDLMTNLLNDDFQIVNTPALEFRESFNDKDLKSSFFTVDVKSGRELVLRSDITPQISRLLQSRLSKIDFPIKICYQGDIFLTKNDELYSDRQVSQVGFEIIEGSVKDELVAIAKSLELISKFSDRQFYFEISLPNLLDDILCVLNDVDLDEVKKAVSMKNISKIRSLVGGQESEAICEIISNLDDINIVIANLHFFDGSVKISSRIEKLIEINNFVNRNFGSFKIINDVLGQTSNSYYSNIAFKVFAKDYSYPLLKGGDYFISDKKAIGATFYVNHIRNTSS